MLPADGLAVAVHAADDRSLRDAPRAASRRAPAAEGVTLALPAHTTLSGRVIDAQSRKPIPGALVYPAAARRAHDRRRRRRALHAQVPGSGSNSVRAVASGYRSGGEAASLEVTAGSTAGRRWRSSRHRASRGRSPTTRAARCRCDRYRDRERSPLRWRPADGAARPEGCGRGRPGAHGPPGALSDRRARSGPRLHRGRDAQGLCAGRGRGQRPAPAPDKGRDRARDEARRPRVGRVVDGEQRADRRRRDPRHRDAGRGWQTVLRLGFGGDDRRAPMRRPMPRAPSRSPTSSPGATT